MKKFSLILMMLLVFNRLSFCEEDKQQIVDVNTISDAVSKAYEKAILHVDAQKAAKKAKEDKEVTAKLDLFLDGWLRERSLKRQAGLSGIIEQEWEKTITSLPYHMDYYLRDFSISAPQKDIQESESVTNPYRADVLIKEILYVEQGPLIAEPRTDYHFTASINVNMALEYNKAQNAWQIADAKERITALDKGWPEEVAKKVGLYFIPQ